MPEWPATTHSPTTHTTEPAAHKDTEDEREPLTPADHVVFEEVHYRPPEGRSKSTLRRLL